LPTKLDGIKKIEVCPVCGVTYGDFRTGMTFSEVRATLNIRFSGQSDWVFIHRNRVLNKWCGIKKTLWNYHLEACECSKDIDETDSAINGCPEY
jgi:hypothetical protein